MEDSETLITVSQKMAYNIKIVGSGPIIIGDSQNIRINMGTSGKYHNNFTNIEINFLGNLRRTTTTYTTVDTY